MIATITDLEMEIKLEPASPYVQLPLSPESIYIESNKVDAKVERGPINARCNFKVSFSF